MKQIFEITLMNLRAIPARLGTSLVICVGTASVVAVLVTVLAMATGLTDLVSETGEPDRVVVVRKGALAESLSSLSREAVLAVETSSAIARLNGRPEVSPEVLVSVSLPRAGTPAMRTETGTVLMRGITPFGWNVRPEIKVSEGRMPEPGRFEVIAGRAATRQFDNLTPGSEVSFYSNTWKVVGVFDRDGGLAENQLLTDAATLMSASNRNIYSSLTARLADEGAFDELKSTLENDPRLLVEASLEPEFYARQIGFFSEILELVAYVVSGIMAVGALFGAVNTMYTAVAARSAEIATLRAIGFGPLPVLVSVLVEALLLSLTGAAVGAAISWFLFNGNEFTTGGTLAQIGVSLNVGVEVIAVGILWGSMIGVLAGLLPALRATRVPVVEGLRV